MEQIMVYPQHLAGQSSGNAVIDAGSPQPVNLAGITYIFDTGCASFAQGRIFATSIEKNKGHDRGKPRQAIVGRNRRHPCRTASKPSWLSDSLRSLPRVQTAAMSKNMLSSSQRRSQSSQSLPANTTKTAQGRAFLPALDASLLQEVA